MRIAIVGYGRMGQQIEQLIEQSNDHVVDSISCRQPGDDLTADGLTTADVAIDFSSGDLMSRHIELYAQAGVAAVIGTTGWDSDAASVQDQIASAGIGVVVGSNFSIGVQVMLRLVAEASRQFYAAGDYDVYGQEVHHRDKVDSPSGTAKTIASTIIDNFPSKTSTQYDRVDGRIDDSSLHFASLRGGVNRGQHQVIFDSQADEISLTHIAHSRVGFANGAIRAAEFIAGQTGFYKFEDIFDKGDMK